MSEHKTDNELIAEFMGQAGLTRVSNDKIVPYVPAYDTLWDLLMPVVIRCHEIGDAKEKEFPEHKDLDDATGWRAWSYERVGLSTNIKQVYKNVVMFIKFYNENGK